MRIIISPAKKMKIDTDSFEADSLPAFLDDAERLKAALRQLSPGELKALWKCSDAIAEPNIERLRTMDLRHCLTPAILAYVGIQYQYMAPGVLETAPLAYLTEHLRILSGFYGILRPFDGVAPYRLEMQARLAVGGCANLYEFWGDRLAARLAGETDWVLNLASREYSKAVEPHLPSGVRFLTCTFGERKGGKIVEKGMLCKMARGQMVRWMAERAVSRPEELPAFSDLGYRFSEADSTERNLVFLKGEGML